MYPILIKVRYESLPALVRLRELWIQILFSVIANWIIAPLLMLGLSWAFLPDRPELREGLILVGVARWYVAPSPYLRNRGNLLIVSQHCHGPHLGRPRQG
jgi:ACR3 family arsenite efflux pump ArsB